MEECLPALRKGYWVEMWTPFLLPQKRLPSCGVPRPPSPDAALRSSLPPPRAGALPHLLGKPCPVGIPEGVVPGVGSGDQTQPQDLETR